MNRFLKGGIRFRLLVYAAAIALPLAVVGLVVISAVWRTSREQIDRSIAKQAEIAAVTFEQWLEAQREPLAMVDPARRSDLADTLNLILKTHPHWIGLRVLKAGGETELAQPANAPPLPAEVVRNLLLQLRERDWAVKTDWSRGSAQGIMALAVPVRSGGAAIAQIDLNSLNRSFLEDVKLSELSVFSVIGPQGHILFYRNPAPETYLGLDVSDSAFFSAIANHSTAVLEMESPVDGVRRVYGLARSGDTGCVSMVGEPSKILYEPIRRQRNTYLLFSLAGLLAAIIAAILTARGILRPIRRLSDAARRFGGGALSTRATFHAGGELEELRSAFNSMATQIEDREARLQELDRLKSDFVSGVSHEMRTPLTTVKTLTDVLLRGKMSEGERRELLEAIAAECDRQIDLVLNLLDLSRIEAGTFNIALSPVDVNDVVRSCIANARHSAELRQHRLTASLPEKLAPVLADRKVLRRVLCSLVENAIKYTPDGGRIMLSATEKAGQVKIKVADTGRGIPAEDIPHIFDKFYRGRSLETVVGGEAPGVGLGLYLARTILEEIGGNIGVESEPGRGSTFIISLPAWEVEEITARDGNVQTSARR